MVVMTETTPYNGRFSVKAYHPGNKKKHDDTTRHMLSYQRTGKTFRLRCCFSLLCFRRCRVSALGSWNSAEAAERVVTTMKYKAQIYSHLIHPTFKNSFILATAPVPSQPEASYTRLNNRRVKNMTQHVTELNQSPATSLNAYLHDATPRCLGRSTT